MIEEGEFRQGKKHGYCRVMDGQENTVHFGMWKDDEKHGKFAEYQIDIPVTKYVSYNIDETFEYKMGFFEDGECVKLKLFDSFEDTNDEYKI